jgi:hypothetical protein
MTAPGRPLQNLLGVIQFGEQLRLQQTAEERMRRTSAANMIQQFMTMAPGQNPEDRGALANVLAPQIGVAPEQLVAAVANRPVSSATTGDRAAAMGLEMMEPLYPRIRSSIEQIPDSTVRDIALNAAAQQFAGQPAGQTRVQGAMADPNVTPQEEVSKAALRQLGSMMTVPQMAEFGQAQERIQQAWTQIADTKVATAVNQALQRGELSFRMRLAELEAAGQKTKGAEAMSPAKLMTELFDMTKELTSKPQTKEARGMMGWMIQGKYQQMIEALGGRQNIDPGVMEQLDRTFSPENIVNASPSFWTRFQGRETTGGNKK